MSLIFHAHTVVGLASYPSYHLYEYNNIDFNCVQTRIELTSLYVYVFDVNNSDVPPVTLKRARSCEALKPWLHPPCSSCTMTLCVCMYVGYFKTKFTLICSLQSKIIQQATIQRENCYEEEVRQNSLDTYVWLLLVSMWMSALTLHPVCVCVCTYISILLMCVRWTNN